MNFVMIDKRMKSKIESLYEHNNGGCAIKFIDLDDTFWFENKGDLQEFLNNIVQERYYEREMRKGYFTYKNEHNEVFKYHVESNRGTLKMIREEFLREV